MIQEGETNEIV